MIHHNPPVGASLLAMVVNDNACCLTALGVFGFFASRLAPTGKAEQPLSLFIQEPA